MFGSGRSQIRAPISSASLLAGLDEVNGRYSVAPRKKWKWAKGALAVSAFLAILAHTSDFFSVFGIPPIPTWFEPAPPASEPIYESDVDYKARGFEVDDLDLRGPTSRHRLKLLLELLKDPSEAKDRDFQHNFEQLLAEEAGCATWVSTHFRALHGRWELKLGKYTSAIDDFEKAVDLDSGNWHAKKFLVEAYEKRIKTLEGVLPQERLELKKAYERALKRLKSELDSRVAEFIRFMDVRGRGDPSRLMVRDRFRIRNEDHYGDLEMKKRTQISIDIGTSASKVALSLLARPARRQFLVFGLDEPVGLFDDSFVHLDYAESDARRVASSLRGLGFEGREVIGPQVTSTTILTLLAEMNTGSRPGDELIIYLAGHGISEEGSRGLVTARGADRDLEVVTTSAIARALEAYWGEVTVVLDACLTPRFSSTLHDVFYDIPLPGRSVSGWAAPEQGNNNINWIFAAQDGSRAIESGKFGGGLFTQSLIRFLTHGPQGSFDAEAACQFMTQETQESALQVFGISQVPNCELRESQLN